MDHEGPVPSAPTPRTSRARTTTRSRSPRSSRGRSRSTPRSARAPSAPASARACPSTRTSSSVTRGIAPRRRDPAVDRHERAVLLLREAPRGPRQGARVLTRHPVEPARPEGPGGDPHRQGLRGLVSWRNRFGREMRYTSGFEGVMPYIERKFAEAESDSQRQRFQGYLREVPCPVCDGTRLKPRGPRGHGRRSEHRRRHGHVPRPGVRLHGGADPHRPRSAHRGRRPA